MTAIAPPRPATTRPIDGAFAAEVLDLDLSRPLDDIGFEHPHRAWLAHHVLVFRDQRIAPEQQVTLSRRFGQLQIHVLRDCQLPGHPEVLIVSNIIEDGRPIGLGDAGAYWQSDLSYKTRPSMGSLLHAQERLDETLLSRSTLPLLSFSAPLPAAVSTPL